MKTLIKTLFAYTMYSWGGHTYQIDDFGNLLHTPYNHLGLISMFRNQAH